MRRPRKSDEGRVFHQVCLRFSDGLKREHFFHPADETPFPMRRLFYPNHLAARPVFFFFVFGSHRSGGERRTAIAVLKNDD